MATDNPKDKIGRTKLPLYLITIYMIAGPVLALWEGMLKYGRLNWRAERISLTEYVAACKRHLDYFMEGQDCASDSKLNHLWHAVACLWIILDAKATGRLIDDRNFAPPESNVDAFLGEVTPHVSRIAELHKDKSPKHYTISDNADALHPPA